jgi:hypothetical protein
VLRHPLTALSGSLAVDGDSLAVSGLEAKVGPKGSLAVRGTLPLSHLTSSSSKGGLLAAASASAGGGGPAPVVGDRLTARMSGVELRVRNVYSGCLDADLDLRGSLATPVLGGKVVFSRGTAFLVPPAGGSSGADGGAGAGGAPGSGGGGSSSRTQAELVRTAFGALKAGRARAATAAAADARGEVSAAGRQPATAAHHGLERSSTGA